MPKIPSKELLAKMRDCVAMMEGILQNNMAADTQVADIQFTCWAMVDLAVRLQDSVSDELSDLE